MAEFTESSAQTLEAAGVNYTLYPDAVVRHKATDKAWPAIMLVFPDMVDPETLLDALSCRPDEDGNVIWTDGRVARPMIDPFTPHRLALKLVFAPEEDYPLFRSGPG